MKQAAYRILTALGLVSILGGTPAFADYCGSGKTVTFAGVDWESGAFLTEVMSALLSRGYGCSVDKIPGNTVTLEQATANNQVQIFAEEWIGRSDVWNKAAAAGKVKGVGNTVDGATEGFLVPEYVIKGDPERNIKPIAPDLKSVEQLSDPKYVKLFQDPEEPSKGRMLNCPSGYSCEVVTTAKLEAYDLNDYYTNFRPGTGAALEAAITAAYQRGEPILFYYWSPSSLMGRYKVVKLQEPPFDEACWKSLTNSTVKHTVGCDWPATKIAYGVNTEFAAEAPEIIAILEKATFPIADINAALAVMREKRIEAKPAAITFLKTHEALWGKWVTPEAKAKIDASLKVETEFPTNLAFSIRQPVNDFVETVVTKYGSVFKAISTAMLKLIVLLETLLRAAPWWLTILIFMGLAWAGTRRWGFTAVIGVMMFAIGALGLWDLMVQTLALMLTATLVSVVLGIPIGIAVAKSRTMRVVTLPLLDVMQTMPSFVYLIPVLMLFGLGKVPAIFATVIYALPPLIRLTALGINQVDGETTEAATAFGASPWQLLIGVELPLARPSIMAGVNQTIMMALSMVVVASMIGARGLGEQVLNGIQTLDVGKGLEAGIGIVLLAIVLDRITQSFGSARA
jgi:ABC-type proline/glycine betaine transport system permease subunit/ABC-type proline/glycine betaine transport system substrate-binding protein